MFKVCNLNQQIIWNIIIHKTLILTHVMHYKHHNSQFSTTYLFGISSLRLTREQIKNRLFVTKRWNVMCQILDPPWLPDVINECPLRSWSGILIEPNRATYRKIVNDGIRSKDSSVINACLSTQKYPQKVLIESGSSSEQSSTEGWIFSGF